jgi:hypothetical protein
MVKTVLPYSRVSSCRQLNSKYGGLTRPTGIEIGRAPL